MLCWLGGALDIVYMYCRFYLELQYLSMLFLFVIAITGSKSCVLTSKATDTTGLIKTRLIPRNVIFFPVAYIHGKVKSTLKTKPI